MINSKMKSHRLAGIATGLSMFCVVGSAQATPVQWTEASGGNGHWYEYISTHVNWDTAFSSAQSMTYTGLQGYLATITSAGENIFASGLVGSVTATWLGGADSDAEGTWKWMDGPEAGSVFWQNGVTLTYAPWNSGEPNNVGGNENYLMTHAQEPYMTYPLWNDGPNNAFGIDNTGLGYIVEYSATTSVPEPASLALLSLGILGLGFSRRKKT